MKIIHYLLIRCNKVFSEYFQIFIVFLFSPAPIFFWWFCSICRIYPACSRLSSCLSVMFHHLLQGLLTITGILFAVSYYFGILLWRHKKATKETMFESILEEKVVTILQFFLLSILIHYILFGNTYCNNIFWWSCWFSRIFLVWLCRK